MVKKKTTSKKRSTKNTKKPVNQNSESKSSSRGPKKPKRSKKSKKKVTVKVKKNKYNKKLINRKQAKWHGMTFEVSPKKVNPVTSITLHKGIEIDEESSKLEYSPGTIELTTKLIPELGNDINSQYKKWCSYLKKYDYLYMNSKRIWAIPMMLKDVSVGVEVIDDLGQLRSAEITLSFEEWDSKQRAKVHKKWLKEQESKSKKKKKKIAKGVWVKIKATKYYGGKKKISAYVRKRKWKVAKVSGNKVYLVKLKYPILKSKCSLIGSASSGSVKGSGKGARIAKAAMSRRGCKYVWGATGLNTFDCSGLVWWAHKHCGISFTRTSAAGMIGLGKHISSLSSAKAGDILLFSSNGSASGVHHTGIYIGGGKMVHAPHTGTVVQVTGVTSGYYRRQLYSIRRKW